MSIYLGADGAPYAGGHLLHNLTLFGRLCRALGMNITPDRITDAARALELIHLGRRDDVYQTLRALFVTRQRDIDLFDEAFQQFWRRPSSEQWSTLDLRSLGETRRKKKMQFLPGPEATPDDENGTNPQGVDDKLIALVPTFSQQELLRTKDFAEMTGAEIAAARQWIARLGWSLGTRATRRRIAGRSAQIDPRRLLRDNLRYGGEMIVLPTRTVKIKPRPLVLLCDISGSMERYTRLLLHFMHGLAHSAYQVESFVFSTRLTRITRSLHHKSIDATLLEVGTSVKDWGGGTRTGDALHSFNYDWGRRVLGHGAVALIITDGWDRGDPELLRAEISRLQRNCYRLIWLNPLLGAPQYEPLTRGAQALLPYVDDFLPIRNLANLEMLVKELKRVDWRRPERSAHAHWIVENTK